jgi:hypothetical protein
MFVERRLLLSPTQEFKIRRKGWYMAYRNTIISLATLVAFGTACSKAPSYNTGVQSAATQTADAEVTPNDGVTDIPHGPDMPKTAANEPKKEEAAPAATPPAAPPANTPAAAPLTPEQKAKQIAERGFVAYAVAAPNGQGWNTAQTPYLIGQTVTAAGAVDTAKPVNVYFCNFQGANMTLHSASGDGPMRHGNAFPGVALAAGETLASKQADLDKKATEAEIQAMTNCRAHLVTALGSTPGATYNHQGGNANNAASYVYFKMYTVDPAGVVAAK